MLRRLLAEGLGTAFLLIAVAGSGIAGERLSGGNAALALLANSLATGLMLVALILSLGPISGARLNPLATAAAAWIDRTSSSAALLEILAQVAGGIGGVLVANLMFGEPLVRASTRARSGTGLWLGEVVATFGLLVVVTTCSKRGPEVLAPVVGCYIAGAYWFTSSTSFANPAVTIARSLTDTFSGIRPADVPGFILAQCAGAALALGATRRSGPPKATP